MPRLERGEPAPPFTLPDQDGTDVALEGFAGRRVVVYFYPADDTPGCTAQACDFRDSRNVLQEAGYEVVGISPQDEASHAAFSAKYSLNFPLLVDSDLEVARAYGVVDDGGDYKGIPLIVKRSTFVIDENGNIEQAIYGVRARGHVESLRETLDVA